jgi:membrane protease YdiL (CAAX protease family)
MDGGVDADASRGDQSTGSDGATEHERGDGTRGDRSLGATDRVISVGVAVGVGVFAFLMVSIWGDVLSTVRQSLVDDASVWISLPLDGFDTGFGMLTGVAVYLFVFERGRSFLDIEVPSRRALRYVAVATVVPYLTSVVVTWLVAVTNYPVLPSSIERQAAQAPSVLFVMMAVTVLVIGPTEELLYRNVVQKSLYDVVSRRAAIAIATLVYVGVHVPPILLADVSLLAVFPAAFVLTVLSVLLGVVYARTENVVVPALAHGVYNALIFLNIYVSITLL